MAIQLNHRTNTITTGGDADAAGITLVIGNTGSLTVPKGTTAQRPSTPVAGDFRFNTDDSGLEYYDGTQWIPVLGGFVEDLRDSDGNFIIDGVSVGATTANYLQVTNAATGDAVTLGVAGTDADISIDYKTKGGGTHTFYEGSNKLVEILSAAGGVKLSATKDFSIQASAVSIVGAGKTSLQGDTVDVVLGTGGTKEFKITDGTNDALTVVTSGSNGFTFEAGGSEAKIETTGDLFVNSTGGDIRLGNGTNDGLVINANTPGDTLTLTTLASSVTFSTREKFNFSITTGDVAADFGTKRVAGVDDPVNDTDAANKRYVDSVAAGLDWKESVRVATTGNVTLSGTQTIDGVSLVSGDRVLVKSQTSAETNGIYVVVSGGAWIRASDADEDSEVTPGLAVFVEEGNTYADTGWVLVTDAPITLGTTGLTFTQFTGAAALTIDGEEGITASLSGSVWNITADTDETTITKGSGGNGQLSVYAGAGVLGGQVLRAPASTPGVAQWGALDLSNNNAVTGTLSAANGGTGQNTYSVGDILYATGTSELSRLAIGLSSDANTAYVLKTNASGNAPEWGSITINQISDVSAAGASTGDVLQFNGTEWVPVANTATDKLVRVTTNDTTSGYLDDKVSASTALTKTILNSGADEVLSLSVNVDNSTIIVSSNQLTVGGGAGEQVLVAGASADKGASWTSAAWFSTFELSGNITGSDVVAAGLNSTVKLSAALGIALNGAGSEISLTFKNNFSSITSVEEKDNFVVFDASDSDKPVSVAVSAFLASLNIPNGVTTSGLVVNTGAGYSARSIVASTSADKAGIEVLNGDGVGGNPTIGLDVDGLNASTTVDETADFVLVYDASADENVKVKVSDLVDRTRIKDASDTTYVDTDEISNTVVVAASGQYVAHFESGDQGVDLSAQFFTFNAGASAGVLRLEANGSATDISLRLVPKGTGQVFIGDIGDGVIAGDDGFNLTVTGGSAGSLFLKGGTGGIVEIRDATSAEFVKFENNHRIAVYGNGDTNVHYEDLIFAGTTTNNSPGSIGLYQIPDDASVTFDFMIVGRDQTATDDTKTAGYRVRGVAAKVSGSATTLAVLNEVIAEGNNAVAYNATVLTSSAGIKVVVTGGATDNVKWVATGRVACVKH